MGISANLCCCRNNNKDSNLDFKQPIINNNSISMDYFFGFIPEKIIKQMNNVNFQSYNNKGEIRTEKVMFDENLNNDLENNIKEILYHGEFNENGKKDGKGKMIIIKDKEKLFFYGIWENDNLIKGNIYYGDDSYYSGDIKNYLRHGKGKYFSINEKYDGNWKDDKKNGYGSLIFSDETKYEGNFKNDQFYGDGNIKWKNGCLYEGGFLNNSFNGNGFLKGDNGHTYKGCFKNGKYHGKGIFKWKDLETTEYYDGNYSNGKRDGNGEYHLGNGHFFKGSWKSGVPDGEGFYETNNRKYIGNWRAGIFLQLIEVEEKEAQEENLNLTFPTKEEDINIIIHISTILNTDSSNNYNNSPYSITYLK